MNVEFDPTGVSVPNPGKPDQGAHSEWNRVVVRPTRPEDVPELLKLSRSIYSEKGSWKAHELLFHQEVFPEGQLVALSSRSGRILGMSVSLVVRIARWPVDAPWGEITGEGLLTTHDPQGDTLYGAGIAVRRDTRGMGVGSSLYRAREELLIRLGLARIRAGARISGYREVADELTAQEYVDQVVRGERTDPTLSFQLARGFRVLGIARNYLRTDEDEASLGYAAVVEWSPEPDSSE